MFRHLPERRRRSGVWLLPAVLLMTGAAKHIQTFRNTELVCMELENLARCSLMCQVRRDTKRHFRLGVSKQNVKERCDVQKTHLSNILMNLSNCEVI